MTALHDETANPKSVYLVRHAKTDYNIKGVQGRFCGSSDPPLNSDGIAQAHKLAQRLASETADQIIVSSLKRSQQTGEIISNYLKLPISVDGRLREIDYGIWEGLTKEQIQKQYSDIWRRFINDPIEGMPPGGESPVDVLTRFKSVLSSLQTHDSILVGHKTLFRLYLAELSGHSLSSYRAISDLHLASISCVKMSSPPKASFIDNIEHLS